MINVFDKLGNEKQLLENIDIKKEDQYIKFENGLLIVFMKKDFEVTFTASNNEYIAIISNAFTFPIPFIELPVIICGTANNKDYGYSTVKGVQRDGTRVFSLCLNRASSYTGTVGVEMIAIGRWK